MSKAKTTTSPPCEGEPAGTVCTTTTTTTTNNNDNNVDDEAVHGMHAAGHGGHISWAFLRQQS